MPLWSNARIGVLSNVLHSGAADAPVPASKERLDLALKAAGELILEPATIRPEVMDLRRLSARLGSNPMLVQASNGNTSVKIDGRLWIKGSGRWLANALHEESMVSVELDEVRRLVETCGEIIAISSDSTRQPSIETPMHAVLPHRVVIHVHSVNTIAWAIRRNAETTLKAALAELRWHWIPYVGSGIPLAREIAKRIASAPETEIFVLGNHGLVVCAEDCERAEMLLNEVEHRLVIAPRSSPEPDIALLRTIADSTHLCLPDDDSLHALGADQTAVNILKGGALFPCQAMFLGEQLSVFQPEELVWRAWCPQGGEVFASWFVVAEGAGILFRRDPSRAELANLFALAEVIRRTESADDVRYLERDEILSLMNVNTAAYKTSDGDS